MYLYANPSQVTKSYMNYTTAILQEANYCTYCVYYTEGRQLNIAQGQASLVYG